MKAPMDSAVMIRCSSKDRERLRNLSEKLDISQSSLARVALKAGLKIVLQRGIRVDGTQERSVDQG